MTAFTGYTSMMKAMTLMQITMCPNHSKELFTFMQSPQQMKPLLIPWVPREVQHPSLHPTLTGRVVGLPLYKWFKSIYTSMTWSHLSWNVMMMMMMMMMKRKNTSTQHPWMMKYGPNEQIKTMPLITQAGVTCFSHHSLITLEWGHNTWHDVHCRDYLMYASFFSGWS